MHIEHAVLQKSADGRVDDDVAKTLEADPRCPPVICDVNLAAKVLVDARISHPQVGWVLLGSAESPEHCAQVARRVAIYLRELKAALPKRLTGQPDFASKGDNGNNRVLLRDLAHAG